MLFLYRYTYAGAKDKQLPEVLSYLSMHYYTPLPAIILQVHTHIIIIPQHLLVVDSVWLCIFTDPSNSSGEKRDIFTSALYTCRRVGIHVLVLGWLHINQHSAES